MITQSLKSAWLLLFITACTFVSAQTQGDSTVLQYLQQDWRARVPLNNHGGFLEVNQYLQYWNVVTLRSTAPQFSPRFDSFVRRGRLGVSGRLNEHILFAAGFSYDGIGKDSLTASAGVTNAEDNTTFQLRDVYFLWRKNRIFNVSFGYFRPRVGKESIYSSSFNVSQEKGFPSYQPRFHLVGRGIGRETGLNIGGILDVGRSALLYDVGLFDNNHPDIRGAGPAWSPMVTGRLMLMLGDHEMTEYNLVYFQSGFGLRKGVSIGLNGSYQHLTNRFRNNGMIGADIQINWKQLDLLGEYNLLYRNNLTPEETRFKPVQSRFTYDQVYVIKGAWNTLLENKTLLQYCLMYTGEIADDGETTSAINPFTQARTQAQWAAGVNWLINRDRLKLGLHVVTGTVKALAPNERYTYINPSVQFMM